MEKAYVRQEIEKRVARIEFFHPQHNALPSELLDLLIKNLDEASDNDEVKIIVLQSGGNRTFCAGANFDELRKINTLHEGKRFFSGFANLINAIRENDKLVIGRVQGKTVGGGVGIVAATDICFATGFSAVKLSEIAIGIGPFVIAPAVERKMGKAAFSELCLRPTEWMPAERAREAGLFTRVFENTEKMDDYLDTYLASMASYNPAALKKMKRVLWEGTEHWDELLNERAKMSGELVLSPFTRHALENFDKKK